jgi:uncharacterized short protein YbdD (DUF466 family)
MGQTHLNLSYYLLYLYRWQQLHNIPHRASNSNFWKLVNILFHNFVGLIDYSIYIVQCKSKQRLTHADSILTVYIARHSTKGRHRYMTLT